MAPRTSWSIVAKGVSNKKETIAKKPGTIPSSLNDFAKLKAIKYTTMTPMILLVNIPGSSNNVLNPLASIKFW